MCIMLTKPEASKTQLFNIPVFINNTKYIMSIYINNITENSSGCFMVVPYPLTPKENIALVDVSTDKMKSFRNEVESYCNRNITKSYKADYTSDSSKLEIYNVGNYKISIANDLHQLLNGVNWDVFEKPDDFDERIKVFGDETIYPFERMYIVAQTTKNIKNDGFGIIYKNDNFSYFPTAHEFTQYGNDYDVVCYDLCQNDDNFRTHTKYTNFIPNNTFYSNSLDNKFEVKIYTDERYRKSLNDICNYLRNNEYQMLNENKVNIKINKLDKLNTIKIKGKYSNSNIIYRHK